MMISACCVMNSIACLHQMLTQENTAECQLWLLSYLFVRQMSTLQTGTVDVFQEFLEKMELSVLGIIYVKKDWIISYDLSPSFSNSSSIVFSFREGSANPKDERYLVLFSTIIHFKITKDVTLIWKINILLDIFDHTIQFFQLIFSFFVSHFFSW